MDGAPDDQEQVVSRWLEIGITATRGSDISQSGPISDFSGDSYPDLEPLVVRLMLIEGRQLFLGHLIESAGHLLLHAAREDNGCLPGPVLSSLAEFELVALENSGPGLAHRRAEPVLEPRRPQVGPVGEVEVSAWTACQIYRSPAEAPAEPLSPGSPPFPPVAPSSSIAVPKR